MNREEYQTYLASREWALKREAIRERARGICERCRLNQMEAVHHLTYARIGNEPLEDLQAVCNLCHEFLSGKTSVDPVLRPGGAVRIGGKTVISEMLPQSGKPIPGLEYLTPGRSCWVLAFAT